MTDKRAEAPAVACGYAFQLTNILRDVGEDATNGRIYLPDEDLQKHNYTAKDLLAHRVDDRFRNLMKAEILRRGIIFSRLLRYGPSLSPDAVRMFAAMFRTYCELLDKIEHNIDHLFQKRMRVNRWHKGVHRRASGATRWKIDLRFVLSLAGTLCSTIATGAFAL